MPSLVRRNVYVIDYFAPHDEAGPRYLSLGSKIKFSHLIQLSSRAINCACVIQTQKKSPQTKEVAPIELVNDLHNHRFPPLAVYRLIRPACNFYFSSSIDSAGINLPHGESEINKYINMESETTHQSPSCISKRFRRPIGYCARVRFMCAHV